MDSKIFKVLVGIFAVVCFGFVGFEMLTSPTVVTLLAGGGMLGIVAFGVNLVLGEDIKEYFNK